MSSSSNSSKTAPEIKNIIELLAHSLALEEEAVERYAELARLMEAHNNNDVAVLFKKMSNIEKLHVEDISKQIQNRKIKKLPVIKYQWVSMEGPETTDPSELHYLMTPYQALNLALLNERRAYEYYKNISESATDKETRSLAEELAVEEEEHVALMKEWLDKVPETESGWDYDDDDPNVVD